MDQFFLRTKFIEIAETLGISLNDGELPFGNLLDVNSVKVAEDSSYQTAMQPWLPLGEECLRYLTVMSILFQKGIEKHNTDFVRAQWSLVSRACQDCRAILKLIDDGFTLQADTLLASYLETLEFAAALFIDSELAGQFVSAETPEESNAFWFRYIAKSKARNKIDALMKEFFVAASHDLDRDEYEQWRSEHRRILGSSKHPNYVSVFVPLFENFPEDSPPFLQMPARRSYSVKTIQALADACVEYANVILLLFARKSEDSDQDFAIDAQEIEGLIFEEEWLNSYATRGHKFMQTVWIYYLEQQDLPPFNIWRDGI